MRAHPSSERPRAKRGGSNGSQGMKILPLSLQEIQGWLDAGLPEEDLRARLRERLEVQKPGVPAVLARRRSRAGNRQRSVK